MRTLSTHVPALVERLLDLLTALRWFFARIMPNTRARRIEVKLDQLGELVARQAAGRAATASQEHHLTRMVFLQSQGAFDRPASSELFRALWTHVAELPAEVARVLITEFGDQMKLSDQAKPGTTTASDGGAA